TGHVAAGLGSDSFAGKRAPRLVLGAVDERSALAAILWGLDGSGRRLRIGSGRPDGLVRLARLGGPRRRRSDGRDLGLVRGRGAERRQRQTQVARSGRQLRLGRRRHRSGQESRLRGLIRLPNACAKDGRTNSLPTVTLIETREEARSAYREGHLAEKALLWTHCGG